MKSTICKWDQKSKMNVLQCIRAWYTAFTSPVRLDRSGSIHLPIDHWHLTNPITNFPIVVFFFACTTCLVLPSISFLLFFLLLASLLLPGCSSNLQYCPCPSKQDWGTCISGHAISVVRAHNEYEHMGRSSNAKTVKAVTPTHRLTNLANFRFDHKKPGCLM